MHISQLVSKFIDDYNIYNTIDGFEKNAMLIERVDSDGIKISFAKLK